MSGVPMNKIQTDQWAVPSFEVNQLRDRQHRYAVCIFVINEGERIGAQLHKMSRAREVADIIIADGGSTDGSLEQPLLEECGVSTLLTKTGPGKLSAQMRMALAWCLQQGYEGIVVIDGNNKDNPEAIENFITHLEQEYDHLQGSRYVPGGKGINTPFLRHWGVKLLHAPLISLAAGFTYTDTTNGFRAYSRNFLLDPRVQPFRECFTAYELHYYLAIRAARLGFRVKELPVERCYPDDGSVPSKISKWSGNWTVLKTLFKACGGTYNP